MIQTSNITKTGIYQPLARCHDVSSVPTNYAISTKTTKDKDKEARITRTTPTTQAEKRSAPETWACIGPLPSKRPVPCYDKVLQSRSQGWIRVGKEPSAHVRVDHRYQVEAWVCRHRESFQLACTAESEKKRGQSASWTATVDSFVTSTVHRRTFIEFYGSDGSKACPVPAPPKKKNRQD